MDLDKSSIRGKYNSRFKRKEGFIERISQEKLG